ncbi:MAG: branched-chain-amino-acid transaminase [Chloroflexi bacterium]|nr:branched-chain-amino-acid transaminase [Chloroflexota bacterium]
MATRGIRDTLGTTGENPSYVWMSGDLVAWDDAVVHSSTLGWSAISMVFEGIRGYWNAEEEQLNIFHLDLHLHRLLRSMKVMRMTSPWSVAELKSEIVKLVQANEFRDDIYVQPLAYFGGSTTPGYLPVSERPGDITIFNRQIGSVLGSGRTVTCGVSSWTRISDNVMPPRVKAIANYQNSRYVADESSRHGYDFGIILNPQGKVSEISYACLYIVRDGVAITPPVSAGILESINRDVVRQLFENELGIPVVERDIDRTELYIADEVFICGTGAEVQAVSSIDGYTIGNGEIGPAVSQLEQLFHDVVRGKDSRYEEWLSTVY